VSSNNNTYLRKVVRIVQRILPRKIGQDISIDSLSFYLQIDLIDDEGVIERIEYY
jgi:hypothetical protein